MPYVQLMITNISLLMITLMALVGNGLISFLIIMKAALRKKSSNYMIAALTSANFVLCIVSLSYEAFLIAALKPGAPNFTNISAGAIIYSTTPFIGGTMMSSVLVMAIAWDRLYALMQPVSYRSVNHKTQTVVFCSIGAVIGLIMMLFNLRDGDVHLINLDCAAGGCFWGDHFRVVWAIVGVAINGLTTVFSIGLLRKLRQHQKKVTARGSETGTSTIREEKAFMQANMIAMYISTGCTVFITLPFLVNGFSTMVGSLVFQKLGPFVTYGVFCSAAFNVVVYGFKQQDIREHLLAFLGNKSAFAKINLTSTVSRTQVVSVVPCPPIPTSKRVISIVSL